MTERELKNSALNFIEGKSSPEEEEILFQWFETNGISYEDLFQEEQESRYDAQQRLFAAILERMENSKQPESASKWSVRARLIPIAASILLISTLVIGYFYVQNDTQEPIHYTQLFEGDVGPGGNNAQLELGDGRLINLDGAAIGDLGVSGGIQLEKKADGVLSIDFSNIRENNNTAINTIKTPAGGQYQVVLPDGTKIWLNASSSIAFPSSFGKHREVRVTGEVYFEVAPSHDDKKRIPFFVVTNEQRIEVLGTHFNVSDYPGEETKTALVEGSVRIQSLVSPSSQLLEPGQEARNVNGVIGVGAADLSSTLAWKEGDFIFNNEDLRDIMRKLERWYDIQVEYSDGVVPRKFSGAVSRSKNLSEVLEIMAFTGKVTFKIEGRRVLIMM